MGNIEEQEMEFIKKLRFEAFETEQVKAEESLALLEKIVADQHWENARDLLSLLRNVQNSVEAKMKWETTPCNIVKRAIKLVIDEYNTCRRAGDGGGQSLFQFVSADPASEDLTDYTQVLPELRDRILESVSEYKSEVEQSVELIAVQGESKIHSDEVIMTCGFCPMVLAFLTHAAKRRKFHVIVAEGAPKYDGHKMAKSLSSSGIQTTLIQDVAIFSMMSRVNKVIIGTRTVLSNGGIRTFVGAAPLADAAKFYSNPDAYVCVSKCKSRAQGTALEHHRTGNAVNLLLGPDIP
ncbi:unnamed protein product, partial [Meganyctiphanes norvegica]